MQSVPELLMPAGNLEKLKVAIMYGADALYLAGQSFGLRSAATNFSPDELEYAVKFAHERNVKIYVVINSFLHDEDLSSLPEFVKYLDRINVDAIIASDLGSISTISQISEIPIHLSTQASCLNSYSAMFWKEMGVKRVILGREASIEEGMIIKKKTGLEVEMFIHGSMCMAYSGHCTISNFTQGRDSNRGGCAHSCRFEYDLEFDQDKHVKDFFMSSKDLKGIHYLEQFIDAGIDSIKVEGRMKSYHYVGTVSKVYSNALNYYKEHQSLKGAPFDLWEKELDKITHRDYTEASLVEPADKESIYFEREHDESDYSIAGFVLETKNDYTLVEARSKFSTESYLELLPFESEARLYKADSIKDLGGRDVDFTKPGQLIKLPPIEGAKKWNLIRCQK